jgi:hypothetical protein
MKHNILFLYLFLTGCAALGDKVVKPAINEDNYWNTPCIWDGAILKKPWFKKDNNANNL